MLHIDMQGINKWFGDLHVLRNITLGVERRERIVICGPSGSGKSTLIRCINRLETHHSGRIVVDGVELTNTLTRIDEVRRNVGMVFQQFNLFPHLTALENCTLAPVWAKKLSRREANDVAMHYLRRVRIPEQANKYPGQLSGGQQQRVAVARALANEPDLILADEPTAALDSHRGRQVMELFRKVARERGAGVMVVTHDHRALDVFDRTLDMEDGRVVATAAGTSRDGSYRV